jgi:two-component sensor histidine kinase
MDYATQVYIAIDLWRENNRVKLRSLKDSHLDLYNEYFRDEEPWSITRFREGRTDLMSLRLLVYTLYKMSYNLRLEMLLYVMTKDIDSITSMKIKALKREIRALKRPILGTL